MNGGPYELTSVTNEALGKEVFKSVLLNFFQYTCIRCFTLYIQYITIYIYIYIHIYT